MLFRSLADMYWMPAILGLARPDFVVGRALANEALRLDPESADGHIAIAWIMAISDWDWVRSEAEFRRAISLDPSSGWGYLGLSDLLADVGLESRVIKSRAVRSASAFLPAHQ